MHSGTSPPLVLVWAVGMGIKELASDGRQEARRQRE
jgi:hypothetical protein